MIQYMKLHRFIGAYNLAQDEVKIEKEDVVKQIRNVLRLENDEKIILCDGQGEEAIAEITELAKNFIKAKILERKKTGSEPERRVTLYLAILKKENFELAVQKAIECGVSRIVPIITERTIKTGLNKERLEKIIMEASEQSGRGIVPELDSIMDLKKAMKESKAEEKILFDLSGDSYKTNTKASSIIIFIGPEGGFTENEIFFAKENKFTISSLGTLTLRAETAAIVTTYRSVLGI